jgi:hypothetical protein
MKEVYGRKYIPREFDIAEFMRNYDAKKRKESTDNNKKNLNLTLADLQRPGEKASKTFIKDDD